MTMDILPNERLTVLFLDHTAKLGGGEIALLHLLQHLDRRRFEPVVVLAENGPFAEQLRALGIESYVFPLAPHVVNTRKESLGASSLLRLHVIWDVLAYCTRVGKFARNRGVDLIHTNSLKADIIGGIAARIAKLPVVWHVRDRIDSDYLPPFAAQCFRLLCRVMPDFIVANSGATLRTMRLPGGARYAVVHSGHAVVHDGIVPRAVAEKEHSQTMLVGMVGRLTRWKGQHVFLKAAEKVRRRFPSARFRIIGSAMFGEEAYEREIRKLATSLGLDDCVEFMGFRGDVPRLIDEFDVLVHASITGEPFGQVIIEGMLAGKPVVATNGGGVPEIVEDWVTGLLVPMSNASAMSDAICSLLANPSLARRMGTAGRDRALKNFTVELAAQRMEGVFEKVVRKRSAATTAANTPVSPESVVERKNRYDCKSHAFDEVAG